MEFSLDPALASRLVAAAGLTGPVHAVEPLAGGVVSAVFAVHVGETDVVVKVYPDVARARMRKELWACEFLADRAPSLPVPKVLAVDDSESLIPHAFSVLTRLPGAHLRSRVEALTDEDLVDVYRQMGELLRTLHGVGLQEFGEVMPGRGGRHQSNREFMLGQLEHDLEMFQRQGGDERLGTRLAAYIADREELLTAERPSFCHNDGHDANMLVAPSEDGWLLSGLLDFEHALASDPLLDLAKTYYFAPGRSEAVLEALTAGHASLGGGWRDTFDLYLVYHQLQLWNLLAGLGVADRLPQIALELAQTLDRSR